MLFGWHCLRDLYRYTDAAFWDRMAGDLDERCADGWDVEDEVNSDTGRGHADMMIMMTS